MSNQTLKSKKTKQKTFNMSVNASEIKRANHIFSWTFRAESAYAAASLLQKIHWISCLLCVGVCLGACAALMIRPQAHLEHTESNNLLPWSRSWECQSRVNHSAPSTHKSAAKTTHQRPLGGEGRVRAAPIPPNTHTLLAIKHNESSPVHRPVISPTRKTNTCQRMQTMR